MAGKLVLIGGGHAHMVILSRLAEFVDAGWHVSVIQPSEYHYYSGMGPGMLGETYRAAEIRFETRKVVEERGAEFVLGKAVKIDPVQQLIYLSEGKEAIPYDLLSCNCGSYVPAGEMKVEGDEIYTAKPIERLLTARKKILAMSQKKKLQIGIVGGGPSAVEFAGNVEQLSRRNGFHPPHITMYCGELLSGLPRAVRVKTAKILKARGVDLVEGVHCTSVEKGTIFLSDGMSHESDLTFCAFGVKPSQIFKNSDLKVGDDGGLLVNEYLQAVDYDNIFGGGDCISFEPQPLDKVGVYAVRQNDILFHNLMSLAEAGKNPLQPFESGGDYLQILNLGRETGVLTKWGLTFAGKFPFTIKDYIDRKFIEKFSKK